MNQTLILQENTSAANDELVKDTFRLRHETFIDRLDWDITSVDGMERDQFDDMKPYHIAVKTEEGVSGSWRALPTKGDYMLRSVFPELLQGECIPEEEDVWEISRFAVRKGSSKTEKANMSGVTIDLVRSFHQFAVEKGIKSYVTVTTVACERLLRQLGVNVTRMGEGKAMQIGKERTVALWVEVNDNLNIVTH